METSILKTVKKVLGLSPDYTAFDEDIILFVNGALSTLTQLGVGPEYGLSIENDTADWDTFLGGDPRFNMAKTYVCLKTKLAFDPPATSFAINAIEEQIKEQEWRISVQREDRDWTPPRGYRVPAPLVVDGGAP